MAQEPSKARRKVLIALGSGIAGVSQLPAEWTRPVVNALVLPAHALTSGPACPMSLTAPGMVWDACDEPDETVFYNWSSDNNGCATINKERTSGGDSLFSVIVSSSGLGPGFSRTVGLWPAQGNALVNVDLSAGCSEFGTSESAPPWQTEVTAPDGSKWNLSASLTAQGTEIVLGGIVLTRQ